MNIPEFIIAVFKGSILVAFCFFVLYGFYWMLKKTGIFKLFKRKIKPTQEIYEEVADNMEKGNTFDDLAQEITKYPIQTQHQYLQAYLDFKKVKGGIKQNA